MPEVPPTLNDDTLEAYEARYGSDPVLVRCRIKIPYRWHVGAVASAFFRSLVEERRIFGLACAACSRVYAPPRRDCPRCFARNGNRVEVGPGGVLVSYTVVRRADPALALRPLPYALGLVRLDGADTAFCHLIEADALERLSIGDRVTAEFADERPGSLLAIRLFRKVS